jgi:hypothetical protein
VNTRGAPTCRPARADWAISNTTVWPSEVRTCTRRMAGSIEVTVARTVPSFYASTVLCRLPRYLTLRGALDDQGAEPWLMHDYLGPRSMQHPIKDTAISTCRKILSL